MKLVMQDWDDERCTQILRNCWKALPEHGKVLVANMAVPEDQETSLKEVIACFDLIMLAQTDGGKERTKAQWNKLLGDVGFARIQFVHLPSKGLFQNWIIECCKT